jgi:serine/threonine-protein kinase HipA
MNNAAIRVLCAGRLAGRLARTPERLCVFEYDAGWLADGFPLSPFALPLEKRMFVAERDPFQGNFGVFEDSLPDGWGRLLVDRLLRKNGFNPAAVGILDRLAIVGKSGMGALEYEPEEDFLTRAAAPNAAELERLAAEASTVLAGGAVSDLEALARATGSSNGARPKVFVRDAGVEWLVKFKSGSDPDDIGKMEFRYWQAARAAGVEVPDAKLFHGKFFGVRRFDRTADGAKVFMISAAALLDSSHRLPSLDYEDLFALAANLTRNEREGKKLFRLMCFNVLASNRDDHSKNFSFLFADGGWRLAPAYDLTFSEGPGGEHSTTVAREGRAPGRTHLLAVANRAGLRSADAEAILADVEKAVRKFLPKQFVPQA